jgi:signal transduction histidine kinase
MVHNAGRCHSFSGSRRALDERQRVLEHALHGKGLAGVEFRQARCSAHLRKRSLDDVGLHVMTEKLVIPDERASVEERGLRREI